MRSWYKHGDVVASSDKVSVTPNIDWKNEIALETTQNTIFSQLWNMGNISFLFSKPLQCGQCDVLQPCSWLWFDCQYELSDLVNSWIDMNTWPLCLGHDAYAYLIYVCYFFKWWNTFIHLVDSIRKDIDACDCFSSMVHLLSVQY